jgi:hypothetical protein
MNAKGIVQRLDHNSKPNAGDVEFSPDYTVTSTNDGGGPVLTNVEVILCFWGSFWSRTPAPSPSSDQYKTAVEGILTGPYMGGLRQYRGVGQGTLIYSEINDSTDPTNGYTDADVVNMLKNRLDNTSMPPPIAGHNRFYAVILPTGINNSNTNLAGQHQSFTYNGITGYYAWVDNSGSLTGHNCVTKVFSHELVEACTNPNVDTLNNGILVNGITTTGTNVTNDEIGDTCNNQFATADMNGIQCSVQSYWSKIDNLCILHLGTAAFWVDKNTFGKDEVQDVINTNAGKWEKAFWVVIDGFSKNSFNSLHVTVPNPTGSFANLTGVSISQNADIDYENGADPSAQQRIRIAFDITFTMASLGNFPSSGSQTYELDAFITTNGNRVPGSNTSAPFELVAGADPYFTNINPSQNNFFYLSQDLRVFTATPSLNNTPVPGAPAFTTDNFGGAYAYIQSLLDYLNNNYYNTNGTDPFNGASNVIPGQTGAYTGDSSVTPLTNSSANYNFAIARVRLRGPQGAAGEAQNVRVFFRLWITQTADTDYLGTTYPSHNDASGLPDWPLSASGNHTIPFFATSNTPNFSDPNNQEYGTNGVNNKTIIINSGDSVWKYFGCFLNVYDPSNVVNGSQVQALLTGTHHCIVAQIAYDGAPIISGTSPETSDKLAQRNLQITLSDNPGPSTTHRIPQTFDIRPSAVDVPIGAYPDELMIDWGVIPSGSVAFIYWPQVLASDVLVLASKIYRTHTLSTTDAHTIQCKITGGITYIPIPTGAGENLAGLFTVDLPTTVVTGQEFNIVVRRIGTRSTVNIDAKIRQPNTRAALPRRWRYVVGTFQIKIPVSTGETMLLPEENTLAIMKWRLQQMSTFNRWYPVLGRYITYIAARVDGLGGNSEGILPSPNGVPVRAFEHEYTGKVREVIFDCFGDFEGFVLSDCHHTYIFKTREHGIKEIVLRACHKRLLLSVFVEGGHEHRICKLVIRC